MSDTGLASEPIHKPEDILDAHAHAAATQPSTTSTTMSDFNHSASANAQATKDTAASYASSAGATISDATQQASSSLQSGTQQAASSLQSGAQQASSSASETASSASQTLQNAASTAGGYAQSTLNSISNHPTVQQISNGPVGENVKAEAAKTNSEFQDLANSRTVPSQTTATGQRLTHYHSFFYKLLSWDNPRATGIAFASTVVFIFMARYLNLLHYAFRFTYIILGITATLEGAGKLLFSNGLAAQVRPRRYWTIPRASLESSLDDFEQLVNFFVIEAQRIVFAENIYVTVAAFLSAFVSYYLIKILPFWGLVLVGDSVLFLAPLLYVTNKEAIDGLLERTGNVIDSQTAQLKDLTAQHTGRATETIKSYTNEYTTKAQQYIGGNASTGSSIKSEPSTASFPSAPTTEPKSMANTAAPPTSLEEPLIH